VGENEVGEGDIRWMKIAGECIRNGVKLAWHVLAVEAGLRVKDATSKTAGYEHVRVVRVVVER